MNPSWQTKVKDLNRESKNASKSRAERTWNLEAIYDVLIQLLNQREKQLRRKKKLRYVLVHNALLTSDVIGVLSPKNLDTEPVLWRCWLCHGHAMLRLTSPVAEREVHQLSGVVMKKGNFPLSNRAYASLWGGWHVYFMFNCFTFKD